MLSRDEARWIAANVAKVPQLTAEGVTATDKKETPVKEPGPRTEENTKHPSQLCSGHPERLASFDAQPTPDQSDVFQSPVAERGQFIARGCAIQPVGDALGLPVDRGHDSLPQWNSDGRKICG